MNYDQYNSENQEPETNIPATDTFREEVPVTNPVDAVTEPESEAPLTEEPVETEPFLEQSSSEETNLETDEKPEQSEPTHTQDPVLESGESAGEAVAPKKKGTRFLALVLAFAVGTCVTSLATFLALPKLIERQIQETQSASGSYLTPPNPALNAEQAGAPEGGEKKLLSVVEISRRVGPAVVGVNTVVQRQTIFGSSALASGSGSGIIISNDGYIVTNNHVIEGASEIAVTLNDGEEYQAVLIGADARTDLAVIKIEGENFPVATLGNSSELQVGELAVAIGNPLGNELAGSVTGGYISALNRSITVDDQEFNLIQTDAAINPGNSGGALVNNYGEVIGINSVKMSASGVEGIGFAIPIDEAKPIIDDLIANGYVKGRPVIGIAGRNVSEQDSMYYDIPVGIYVVETSPYSAAERAGIKTGDVITEVDGVKVKTVDELNKEKEKHVAGDTVVLTVIRGTDTLKVPLVLQEDKPLPPEN